MTRINLLLAATALLLPSMASAKFVITKTNGETVTIDKQMFVQGKEPDFQLGYVNVSEIASIERDHANVPDTPDIPTGDVTTFDVPANTYIVSAEGTYAIPTKHVSGTAIENIDHADWIWGSKEAAEDEQEIISNVSYANGYVTFTVTEYEGVATIGAFDNDGKCVWVWLIWHTDEPQNYAIGENLSLMDRGIGATAATSDEFRASIPTVVYQFGRPVPLFGGYSDEGRTGAMSEAKKYTQINPELSYEWQVVKHTVSMEESIAEPTTFFTGGGMWSTDDREVAYAYWNTYAKSDYDPSPAGYRLPIGDDWIDVAANLDINDTETAATYTRDGQTSWFPNGGQGRMYDSGENIQGYPGTMYWNRDLEGQLNPVTGQTTYYPSRVSLSFKNGSQSKKAIQGNATFAHAIRPIAE